MAPSSRYPTSHTPGSPWRDPLGRAGSRCAQILLILALVSLAVYALLQIRLLLIPVLIALILTAAIGPAVNMLRRAGLPDVPATLLAFLALLVVLAATGTLIVLAVRSQWEKLVAATAAGLDQFDSFLLNGPFSVSQEQLAQGRQALVDFAASAQARSSALSGLSVATEFFAGTALMIIVLFFFLKDGARIWDFLLRPFSGPQEDKLRRAGKRTLEVLGSYVRGTATIALIDATAIGIALLVLQVPLAVPLAMIVFLGAFIPLVGATVAGVLAVLVALVTRGPIVALIVVVVVIAVNQLENHLLQPVVMARSLKLHALVILFSLTAGTILAGIIGAVLAVPLAAVAWAVLQVWTAEDPRLEDLNPDMPPAGSEPT
jgi:predicted PurR-regulated permease PerM